MYDYYCPSCFRGFCGCDVMEHAPSCPEPPDRPDNRDHPIYSNDDPSEIQGTVDSLLHYIDTFFKHGKWHWVDHMLSVIASIDFPLPVMACALVTTHIERDRLPSRVALIDAIRKHPKFHNGLQRFCV